MNELNSNMQGPNRSMLGIGENMSALKKRTLSLERKMANGKIAAFPTLSAMLEDTSDVSLAGLETIFQEHLKKLQLEMNRYIPENVELQKQSWVINPFYLNVTQFGDNIPRFQEGLIDLLENKTQK
jgi:hypothetical protein